MDRLQKNRKHFFYSCILCITIFSACSDEEEVSQLIATAGMDINALVGQQVTLNGAGSMDMNGNPFNFSWRFISKPSQSSAQLENNLTETPFFIPDLPGKYKIELEVSNTSTSKDTVTISAFNVNQIDGSFQNPVPGPNVGIRDFVTIFGEICATCEFTEIGGIEANKIACFDGSTWHALGCGLEEGSIYGMIGYKGELYVTGQFDEIGCIPAKNIARWNGSSWSDVAGGLTGGDNSFGYTLKVYKDELYVGGQFTSAGNVNAVNIAKWDGVKWSAVGTIENGSVRELEVFKDKLFAGGFFTSVNGSNIEYIASYDGNSWSSLGPFDELELKSTGVVRHMAVFNDMLYISGDFSQDNIEISELITWNGNKFSDFGRAFSLYNNNIINELAVIDNTLYIGGSFGNVVASQANNILQWDGKNWGIMGQGVSGTVLSIDQFDGEIYIGGDFTMAGGSGAQNISIWNEN